VGRNSQELTGAGGHVRRGLETPQDGIELLAEPFEPADGVIVDDVGEEQIGLKAPEVVEDAWIVEQARRGIAERDRTDSLTVNDEIVAGLADPGPELSLLRVIPGQLGVPRRDQAVVGTADEAEAEIVRRLQHLDDLGRRVRQQGWRPV
jgi:hypothetical protein